MSANLVMVPARSFLGTVESLGCLYGATQVTFPSRPERKKRALHFAGTHAPLPPIRAMLKWAARTYVQVSANEKRALSVDSHPLGGAQHCMGRARRFQHR